MKEIKVRAWDETNQYMVYPTNPHILHSLSSGDILNRFETVMLYTGKKDQNGEEIYEGDIIYKELYAPDDPRMDFTALSV